MKIEPPPLSITPPTPQDRRAGPRAPQAEDALGRAGAGKLDQEGARPTPSQPTAERLPALVPGEGVVDVGDIHPGPLIPNLNVRALSSRDMADLSFELYANGILNWEEHELLAFQPELNPAYDSTVGALTGEAADPDAPKDHLAIWEERFAFETKYNAHNRDRLYAVRQIVTVLRQLSAPLDLSV